MPQRILIIGCGDIGQRVAEIHRQIGDQIFALSHREESQKHLTTLGINVIPGNLDQPSELAALSRHQFHAIYYFAPPPSTGTKDPRMKNFLNAIKNTPAPRTLVYISTTGVYGECAGEWVNENFPIKPGNDRSRRRVDAEQQLQQWQQAIKNNVTILRVAGIYGPDRLPRERIEKQIPLLIESECPPSNRIHIEDLCQICVNAMQKAQSWCAYNVADGNPSTMTDYFNQVADHLGLPRPPQISWREAEQTLSAGMLSYLRESKRIDNAKVLKELDISLKYPNLQKGLGSNTTQA